jgi:hypothetical protein
LIPLPTFYEESSQVDDSNVEFEKSKMGYS